MTDKEREYHARYREKNRERLREYRRNWSEKNKERIREYNKQYARLNRERVLESRRRFEERNRGRATTRYRKMMETSPWSNLYSGAKSRSKHRGIAFDITRDDIREMYTGRCSVTGVEFVPNIHGGVHPLSPSLDRIDPTMGYSKENCRLVINAFNALKGTMDDPETLRVAKLIVSGLEKELGVSDED